MKDFIISPEKVFQIFIELSLDPLTNVYPSGENAIEFTNLKCP
jgi:hypothetical protein